MRLVGAHALPERADVASADLLIEIVQCVCCSSGGGGGKANIACLRVFGLCLRVFALKLVECFDEGFCVTAVSTWMSFQNVKVWLPASHRKARQALA